MITVDPFVSHLPMFHPKRIALKVANAAIEKACGAVYARIPLGKPTPEKTSDGLSTTPSQRRLLTRLAESAKGPIVEIGSWRGETTCELARASRSHVYAVDMYFDGWDPAAAALDAFMQNAGALDNVTLIRQPSVRASRVYAGGPIGLLFIDAQHNFLNTWADFQAWRRHLAEDAFIVFHDVDDRSCPGTRLAAFLASRRHETCHHIDNMLVLRNRARH